MFTLSMIASRRRLSSTSRPFCEIEEPNKRITATPTNAHADAEPNGVLMAMTCLSLDRMTFRTLGGHCANNMSGRDADNHQHLSLSVLAQPSSVRVNAM